jgi:hypothetical protein
MKKLLFACFSLLILGTSCKKSGAGSGSGGTAFMTLTSGSTWNYKETNLNNSTSADYTLTATSKDSLVNGRSYRVFTINRNGANSSDYYNISGGTYYQFTNLSPLLPRFEYRYLVDNAPNWSDPLQQKIGNDVLSQIPNIPSGTEVIISATVKNVLEDGQASLTVNGVNYTGLKKVKTTLESINVSLKVSGLPIPNTIEVKQNQISSYYAAKKGLVKRETKLQIGIQVNIPGQQIPAFDILNINTNNELMSTNIQ